MARLSHSEARKIVQDAWTRVHGRAPSERETLYTQAIALFETGYGRAGQFGLLSDKGLYNWGALHGRINADGSCPQGTAPGTDIRRVCFLVFPSDVEAAAAYIQRLTKTYWPTIEAMRGSPEDVARAMRKSPAYYEGFPGSEESKIATYANAIRGSVKSIGGNLATASAETGNSLIPALLLLSSLGAIGYTVAKQRRWI